MIWRIRRGEPPFGGEGAQAVLGLGADGFGLGDPVPMLAAGVLSVSRAAR
ncbi:hypothetical protein [Yinghuangia soli]|uniref:Uncharacterized protein n=1 Tax=Yinghuangia soli TaxID=2908204 RepID=A0AA41PUN1_9ACTN|nr:hypothetical protein [Yinghuangia soli]MCF2525907.1 hypothetical protein [Yinghuangia soli]